MKVMLNANFGKIVLLPMLSTISFNTGAQETKKLSFSGSLDSYFRQNTEGTKWRRSYFSGNIICQLK